MDAALGALYEVPRRDGRLVAATEGSAHCPARRRGSAISDLLPTSVVQVMQRDAIERLHLTSMLLEPELLDSISA